MQIPSFYLRQMQNFSSILHLPKIIVKYPFGRKPDPAGRFWQIRTDYDRILLIAKGIPALGN
ncbi:hypothetical protein B5E82_10250 [Lachnoclostridium sp. An138]|nr:hypothetical protein B5E82_10250 [Lachnoclostridium sp. An138]